MKKRREAVARQEAGDATAEWFASAWRAAQRRAQPYRHWLLDDALPPAAAKMIADLPVSAPVIGDTQGRRDTHNSTRSFFSPEMRAAYPVCDDVARAFQEPATVSLLAREMGVDFSGSYLRIEYCQDRDGFWLEPHTDIGAKLMTLSVFLSDAPGAENWGTDIYDNSKNRVARAPSGFNQGFAFVPASDTWHGFEARPMGYVRRSIIVNYVRPEWRSRHELSFPETPIDGRPR
ncbi:MAG TPA: hypothetical protein VLW75_03715 [Rhizomicrobium sp.]|nr:hypothetical protein [Rhizomicrobium sp.]